MIKNVALSDCVHFRGFRYGGFGNNIYEDYILGLRDGIELRKLRMLLINRVLGLKANTWEAALGIKLNGNHRSWSFPWGFYSVPVDFEPTASNNPDVICHFSSEGVLASHLNREFFWLERAFQSMQIGYMPDRYGYIQLLTLQKKGQRRFIVLDGNHRISAMHALGITHFDAQCKWVGLRDSRYARIWPSVLIGHISLGDALNIFNRYFVNTNLPLPNKISSWSILYDVPLKVQL